MRALLTLMFLVVCYARNIPTPIKQYGILAPIDQVIEAAFEGKQEETNADGSVRAELDIIYTAEQWEALNKGVDTFAGLMDEKYRWPNNTVPFEAQDVFRNYEWANIEKAMQAWEKYTCLRFKPRTDEKDYVKYVDGYGCSSSLGRIGGRQRITLGRGCRFHSTIVHEIGHAVGFHHEQTRPDRDEYVTVLFENIDTGRAYNFRKRTDMNSFNVSYDYRSVMHYSGKAFSKNGNYTIITKDTSMQNKIGRSPTLSAKDIQQALKMYKCADWCGERSCPTEGFINQHCTCYCDTKKYDMKPVYVCGQGGPEVPTTPIPTRPTTTPHNPCVSDCTGRSDGNYQSCKGCDRFVSCVGGKIYRDRLCPPPLVWDDYNKMCTYRSLTCKE